MLGGRVAERAVEVGPVDAHAMRDLESRESGLARELVLEEVASSRDGDAVKAVLLQLPAIGS